MDATRPPRPLAPGWLAAAMLLAACAGAPRPPVFPDPPLPPAPGSAEVRPEEPAASQPEEQGEGSEPPAARAQGRPTTVVIETGDAPPRQPSLLEASAAAKERRKNAPPPIAVINDDNLSEYARQGKLTSATPAVKDGQEGDEPAAGESPPGSSEEAEPAEGEGAAAEEPATRGELYWREGVRDRRRLWHEAEEAVADLQERAEVLRRQFYSEDDPYVRDSRIKPAWDRVLDRLEEIRVEVEERRAELEAFVEEGRRSGALPGWLREGIDREPRPEAESGDLPVVESQEPAVVEEGGGGG